MTGSVTPPPAIRGLRYDRLTVIGDILRGTIGGVMVLAPVISLPLHPVMQIVLTGLGLLFWWFALRNTLRLQTRISLDAEGITIDGLSQRQIPWHDMTACRARYFSAYRDRRDGWLQLTIEYGSHQKSVIDSAIMDFDQLAEHVAYHAQRQGIEIDRVTAENLIAIGVPARYFLRPDAAPQHKQG